MTDCQPCTPGWYCGSKGLPVPTNRCQQGYYCPGAASNNLQYQCTPGYYCTTGSDSKTPCGSGTYQDQFGKWNCKDCPAGYYCNATYGPVALYGTYECPQGYYCPLGTKYDTEYPCPPGTFLNRTKGERPQDCIKCIGGFACDSYGLANPWRLCAAGYYCKEGANTSTPRLGIKADECPAGRHCPTGKF